MFAKFTENGSKTVGGNKYAYEVKTLILNEDDGVIDITIDPYSIRAAEKVRGAFNMFFRIARMEPERQHNSIITFNAKNDKFVIQGDKQALEEALTYLEGISFISMETSRQVKGKLNTITAPELKLANEYTPLIKKP